MRLSRTVADWVVDHSGNLFVVGLISVLFPQVFIRSYYKNNCGNNIFVNNKQSCLTISFDCDYPRDVEAMPGILKVLKQYGIKTSFACVGYWIEKYPDEHKMILDYGHELVNHTYSHPDNELLNPGRKFKNISRSEKKEEIEKCHDICNRVLNYQPIGCRIPHFKNLFSEDIYGILKELGYSYSSSTLTLNTKSFGLPFRTREAIWEFPLSTCPVHPFTVFDTWHSFNSRRLLYRLVHQTEDQYINLFKTLIDIGITTNSYINIYIDPYDIVHMKKFYEILGYIANRSADLAVMTYEELVNNWEHV